jgi:putative tricarboxylic transport membrane protein
MKDQDVYSGSALVLVSLVGIFMARSLPHMATTGLSAGFFPGFMFMCLGICGLGLIYQGWKRNEKVAMPKFLWKKIIPMLVLAGLYAFALEPIGFRISTLLFVLVTMFFLGERKPISLITVPVITSLSIFYLFSKVFLIALP